MWETGRVSSKVCSNYLEIPERLASNGNVKLLYRHNIRNGRGRPPGTKRPKAVFTTENCKFLWGPDKDDAQCRLIHGHPREQQILRGLEYRIKMVLKDSSQILSQSEEGRRVNAVTAVGYGL